MWANGPPKTLTESDLKKRKYRNNSSKPNSLQTLCYFSSTGNQCRQTRKYNMTMHVFFSLSDFVWFSQKSLCSLIAVIK